MNFTSWVFDSPVDFDTDRPLLIDAGNPEDSHSFNQLKKQVRQLVAGLKAVGVKPGDCVCVNAFNNVSYNILYLGIIGAGAIFTGINPAYSAQEIIHHIDMVGAKILIVEPRMLEKTSAAAKECGIPKNRMFAFDLVEPSKDAEVKSWSTLLQHGESNFVSVPNPDTTVAAYQTSSGTSGLPKAALIPHSYLRSQSMLRFTDPSIPYKVQRLTALPPMHVFATPIVPASIRQGYTTYIMRRWDQKEYIESIHKYQITETWLPPPPLITIPQDPLATKDKLRSVRQIWMGGAGVTYENQKPLYDLLHPDARINQVWGMTETGWVSQVHWPKKQCDNSVGTTLKGCRVRLVDDDGVIVHGPDAVGELQILTPHPMLGYLDNAKASQEAFTVDAEGRWINSGDVGQIDAEGSIYIVDRKKDLVKVRGWQVSPAEVEGALQTHPDVLDVGVIGLPLPNGEGEFVRAYVVPKPNSLLTSSGLIKFAQKSLAKYKCPEEFVFVESIPRNPTGKILRRLLKESAKDVTTPVVAPAPATLIVSQPVDQPIYKQLHVLLFSTIIGASIFGFTFRRSLRALW